MPEIYKYIYTQFSVFGSLPTHKVQTLHFPQGENAEGGWQARFKRPLQWVLNQAPDAKPGGIENRADKRRPLSY